LYLVFYPNNLTLSSQIAEAVETLEGVQISTFLIEFDETKW